MFPIIKDNTIIINQEVKMKAIKIIFFIGIVFLILTCSNKVGENQSGTDKKSDSGNESSTDDQIDLEELSATYCLSNFEPNQPVQFGEIITGKNSLYHQLPDGTTRNDLSGAATDGHDIIFIDDGGDVSDFNFVRIMSEIPDDNAVNKPLSLFHNDLEGATYQKNYFVVTCSLSDPANLDTQWLTRFQIDRRSNDLIRQTSINLRENLMSALKARFGSEWFDRIKDAPAKAGGLNIEGISTYHKGKNVFLWGLRSPLFGENFPTDLHDGVAIIAKVFNPFGGYPFIDFITVDLEGDGVRGMEWIPSLHGYVIIGGPVEKGDLYSLWLLRPRWGLEQLDLPGFSDLCRPETVTEIRENHKNYLVVISEDSGAACKNKEFTFIKAEILSGCGH